MEDRLAVIILAAGEGTRMKSEMQKVLHSLCGDTILKRILKTVKSLLPERVIFIIGYQKEEVKEEVKGEGVEFVEQKELLGTGHALLQAEKALDGFSGNILVLCGDTPLLSKETLRKLLLAHKTNDWSATILSASFDNPSGYGRIKRKEGGIGKIVEELDASEEERKIREINSGVYLFKKEDLFPSLRQIRRNNKKGEYYLTDAIRILIEGGKRVNSYQTEYPEEVLGINTLEDLEKAKQILLRHE